MTEHLSALEQRPDRSGGSWGDGSCSLEEIADRIGAVIAWLGASLQRVLAGEAIALAVEVAEALVRDWIAGLESGARAHFLAVTLSNRCEVEGPRIVGAILDVQVWPRVRSRGPLDPSRRSCEGVRHAPGHNVDGLAGLGRVPVMPVIPVIPVMQRCAGYGDGRRD